MRRRRHDHHTKGTSGPRGQRKRPRVHPDGREFWVGQRWRKKVPLPSSIADRVLELKVVVDFLFSLCCTAGKKVSSCHGALQPVELVLTFLEVGGAKKLGRHEEPSSRADPGPRRSLDVKNASVQQGSLRR